jgi:hypothetical protein
MRPGVEPNPLAGLLQAEKYILIDIKFNVARASRKHAGNDH